jgi:SAM-dependent methyltransferase
MGTFAVLRSRQLKQNVVRINWACSWNRKRRPSMGWRSTTRKKSPSPISGGRWYSSVLPQPRILDVGCGIHKQPGSIGIDRNPASRADVLADLDRFPYPFADSSFDRLTAIHVIEHVDNVIRTMEEFHRLVRPGGSVRIETPHYTDFSSFCDPTHKSHLNSFSFRYFGENHAGFGYYSPVKFREISVHVKLLAFWRWLGFQFLVNRFPRYRRFWEYYLCYVVRGKVMEFEFQVVK